MKLPQSIVNILLVVGILALSLAVHQLGTEINQLKTEKISGWGND